MYVYVRLLYHATFRVCKFYSAQNPVTLVSVTETRVQSNPLCSQCHTRCKYEHEHESPGQGVPTAIRRTSYQLHSSSIIRTSTGRCIKCRHETEAQ